MANRATTFYELLSIPENADEDTIRKAYHRAIVENHPDRNPDKTGADRISRRLNEALETLTDPAKRRQYDQDLQKERGKQFALIVKEPPKPLKTPKAPRTYRLLWSIPRPILSVFIVFAFSMALLAVVFSRLANELADEQRSEQRSEPILTAEPEKQIQAKQVQAKAKPQPQPQSRSQPLPVAKSATGIPRPQFRHPPPLWPISKTVFITRGQTTSDVPCAPPGNSATRQPHIHQVNQLGGKLESGPVRKDS